MARSNSQRLTRARAIGRRPRVGALRGFTLLELMIAVSIGIFLTGALLTIVQMNRTVFGNQSLLAQLQDNERLATSMMSDVVQSAGYFPNPTLNTAGTAFPAAGSFAALQTIVGNYGGGAAPGDSLTVRYMTASGDGILNCSGLPNSSGANQLYVSQFAVQTIGGVSQFVCTMNGTQYALATGVTNMTVLYGVQTNLAAPRNVDTYMNATQVTAQGDWGNVISVLVALTFTNPLYKGPNQGQPATFTIQRVMQVMGAGGPTL
jgi:type IV pilus assembly protein PilW